MVAMFRAALCAAMLLVAQVALAQDTTPAGSMAEPEARRAFEDGLHLLRARQWAEAEASFRLSLALIPRPSVTYDLAFVLYKEGRARESAEVLQHLLAMRESAPDAQYREYAKVLLTTVLGQLSTLHVVVDPASADIRIDRELVPLTGAERSIPLDPGAHELEVSAPGFVPDRFVLVTAAHVEMERRIALKAASTGMATMTAAAQPSAPSRTLREPPAERPFLRTVAPWLAVGMGGALLTAATVTGILAKRADDVLGQACPTFRNCDPSLASARDRALQLGRVTDALLISGGVLIAGGITWRILVPAPAARAGSQGVFVMMSGLY
jgi:hypothetical protein